MLRAWRKADTRVRGWVDSPAADEELLTALPAVFCGWALDGPEPVAAVEIIVDDGPAVPAELGTPRPDVLAGLKEPASSGFSGWTAEVDLSGVSAAEARVRVIATGRSGEEATLSDRMYQLKAHEFLGSIQTPAEVVGSVLTVRGQALVDRRCPATVVIEVDGVSVGNARLRLPASGAGIEHPGSLFAGFEHAVVLDGAHGETRHTVDAVVSGMGGASFRVGEHAVRVKRPRMTTTEVHEATTLRERTRQALEAGVRQTPPPARDSRYRVLVFTHQLDLGGGQLYLQELLRQLSPVLESCTVASPLDGELRSELEDLGFNVVVTGHTPPSDLATYEGQVREHSLLMLNTGCQVVVVNTLGDFSAVDGAARLGIPSLWAIHESFEVDHWLEMRFGRGGPHPYVAERAKHSLSAATRLVFESHATSEMFGAYAPPERRLVVPYGVDVDSIAAYAAGLDAVALRRRNRFDPKATVLVCVGMVEERKAQACLVEAFAGVADEHPEATLVMVGDRPGHYSASLHRVIDSLELGDRIRLLPSTRDIWEWYAIADMLVSASDVESLPRSMLEAMAFGVPVLSASVFGIPELIRDAENGWLFEPRDMRALVGALRRVLDAEPSTRRAIGLAGQALVHERHRSTDYGRSYAGLFRAVTSVPTAPEPSLTGEAPLLSETTAASARTWNAVRPYTMTSEERVVTLCDAIRYISEYGIPGDIVECGVWRGGSMLAAARTLLECDDVERALFLYDTFSGMTPPNDVDRRLHDCAQAADLLAASTRGADIWAVADLEDVKRTMSLCEYPEGRVRYVVGPVEETLPTTMPSEIALLRLDTDWYASTLHELVHLFPKVSRGGVLVLDDYDFWEGHRKAVDEYLAGIGTPVFLARVDGTGRIAVLQG